MEVLIINIQTIAVGLVSIYLIVKSACKNKKIPILGLVLIMLSGVLGVAGVNFAFAHFEDFMTSSPVGIYVVTNIFGLLNSAGLVLLAYSILSHCKEKKAGKEGPH